MSEAKPIISFEEFCKLDLRMAKITEARDHPNADRLICMTIDLGGEQREIIAGLKPWYTPEQLVGKQVVVVTNLQPRKMRGLESRGMLLAAVVNGDQPQDVIVLTADKDVPPGTPVS